MASIRKNDKYFEYVSFLVIIMCGCFLFWRARYGHVYNDEPFCLSLAQRFYNGDALFSQEWNPAQNIGVLLLPVYAFFRLVTGGTTAILLFSRYAYCAAWILTCVLAYFSFKKYTKLAIFAFLYLVLFSPLDYMTLSYTSISLMCVIMLCIFAINEKFYNNKIMQMLAGVIFAVLVLASPFFSFVYAVSTFFLMCLNIIRKNNLLSGINFKKINSFWLFFTIGIIILAIPYLILFLSRTNIQDVAKSIKFILYPMGVKPNIITHVFNIMHELLYPYIGSIPVLIVAALMLFDKHIKKHRILYLLTLCFSFVTYNYHIFINNKEKFNYQMLFMGLISFVLFFLLEKKPYKIFFSFCLGGILYTIINSYSSDTGLMAFSMCMSVCGVAGIIFLDLLLKELLIQYAHIKPQKYFSVFLVAFLLIGQITLELSVRLTRQYWDLPLKNLTHEIEVGPARGIYTNEASRNDVVNSYNDLLNLLSKEDTLNKSFLSYYADPTVYLTADLDYATFSSWTFPYKGNTYKELLTSYYEINPQKIPEFIYFYNGKIKAPDFDFSSIEGYEEKNYNDSVLLVKNSN